MIECQIVLNEFHPPTTFGPEVSIVVDQIMAVRRGDNRAIVLLKGGLTIVVCESYETVVNRLESILEQNKK